MIFNGRRLNKQNVHQYVLIQNPEERVSVKSIKKKVISDIDPFEQKDFGTKNDSDCTLTSIMTSIYYYSYKKLNPKEVYRTVRKNAEKWFFKPNIGTIPFFIKSIYDKSLKDYGINKKTGARLIKDWGYNLKLIMSVLDQNKPIILSIYKDGREYYFNHSVLVIGYEIFRFENGIEYPMLLVYDNWYSTIGYVDYNKLSAFSSINF